MKKFVRPLVLLGGLILFGWYLAQTNPRAVVELIAGLGWFAPLILIPYFLVYVVDCLAWRLCLPKELNIPFRKLFCIRWAGETVNNVLPSAYVGGEALKVFLLRKHGVETRVGASSAVVSKTAQTVGQFLCILMGAVAFLQVGGDNPALRTGMLVVLAGGVFLVVGLFGVQRYGLFGFLLTLVNTLKIRVPAIERNRAAILQVDQDIRRFYHEERGRFYASTGTYLAGWLLDTLEIYFVAHLLGMPILWSQALAVEAFTGVAKGLGMWIPGSLGVQESGIVMLGRLAGLPDTLCVAYALLRRGREVVFALIGWLLLYSGNADLHRVRSGGTNLVDHNSR